MSTFGLIVPGRPVDAGFQQVEANKFLITVPDAASINHVVLFLTGVTPLPPSAGCCIFFSLPDPNASPTWNYLGCLTNEKPSAVYKLSNLTRTIRTSLEGDNNRLQPVGTNNGYSLAFNYVQAPVTHVAQIGISVEPIDSINQMVPAIDTPASNLSSFGEFINKTVGNLFNYCSSFSRPIGEIVASLQQQQQQPNPAEQFVPLAAIQKWYETYSRRLTADPNFWKSLN